MRRKKRHFSDYVLAALAAALMAFGLWVALSPTPPPIPKKTTTARVERLPEFHGEYADGEAKVEEPEQVTEPQLPPLPPQPSRDKPRIAIVIDDVGLDVRGSERAVALPGFVTLAFMPYAPRLKEQTRAAREAGHELLLHMPMEPVGRQDPGPGALMVGLSEEELRQRFQESLASFVGFDGVNNHMGSKFTADRAGMAIVMEELKARHLFFLDSRTSNQSVGGRLAHEMGVPTLSRDVFLDDDMNAASVMKQLRYAESVARHKGWAVAIGHPHAVTLDVLEQWIPEAASRGIECIAVHKLLNKQAD